jgi:murein DD-endopeptidase MepM/ murein hydrolase activator NlpD
MSDKTDYSQPEESKPLQIRYHRVKSGENLTIIAKKYGISIDTICGSNGLRSYDFIRSGVVLRIPSKDGILTEMEKGKRIVDLAKKYKISIDKIIDENDLSNPDFIANGSLVFIPDAKPQNIIKGFMWPTASRFITCGYGWRRNPFNRSLREFHHGLDIRARYEWIRSSKYGKVTYTGWMRGYGKAIIVAHPGGYKTLYAHLSRIIVRRGQYVKQGQMIGRSGNTGRSTGPHLHYEIIHHGRHKNPYYYLTRH